jgi:hypothetical protein
VNDRSGKEERGVGREKKEREGGSMLDVLGLSELGLLVFKNRGITRKGGHMIMQAADKRAYDSSNQQGVCSTLSRIGPGRPTVLPQTCK